MNQSVQSARARVMIGLPVFNGAEHIAGTVASLLAQDYPNKQIAISDNASTDQTSNICEKIASNNPGLVTYVRHERNRGATENFQYLMDSCECPYFMWAGHHDAWSPNFVSECIASLEAHHDAVLAYPEVIVLDDEGRRGENQSTGDRWSTISCTPVERMRTFFWKRKHCNLIYGVYRAELVRDLRLKNTPGGDNLFLAEAQLRGGFVYVPQAVFYARARQETRAEMWERQQRSLGKTVGISPYMRILLEYLRIAWSNKTLSLAERLEISDDIIWSHVMRDHEAFRNESKLGYAFTYSVNWAVARFRSRPLPW